MKDLDARLEIAEINSMSLAEVQVLYNVDTKEEAIQGVLESIESEEEYEDDGMDYDALCSVQGLSRYC